MTLSLQVLERFRTVSGLKLNNKKLKYSGLEQILEGMKYSALKKFEMGKGQSKGLRCLVFNRPESNYGDKLF